MQVSFREFALLGEGQTPSIGGAALTLLLATATTLKRILVGLSLGASIGIVSAMSAYFLKADLRFGRLLLATARGIPLLALIPLFMFWFGDRESGMYLYIAFGVYIVINAVLYEAFCSVPVQFLHQARLLGASRLRAFVSVECPSVLPQAIAGLREALGLSWAFSLGAEYLTATKGLGYLVSQSYLYSDMGKLLILAGWYCILAYGSYVLLELVSRATGRWNTNELEIHSQ